MADREKAIKGLEHCYFGVSTTCYENECPYYQSHDCTDELKNDILALLKEQEPVMHSSRRGTNGISLVWTCGKCGADLEPNDRRARYCSHCGKAVKWE